MPHCYQTFLSPTTDRTVSSILRYALPRTLIAQSHLHVSPLHPLPLALLRSHEQVKEKVHRYLIAHTCDKHVASSSDPQTKGCDLECRKPSATTVAGAVKIYARGMLAGVVREGFGVDLLFTVLPIDDRPSRVEYLVHRGSGNTLAVSRLYLYP